MKYLTQYRMVFLKKDGTFIPYPMVLGDNHFLIITDYCQKEKYFYPSIETINKNNDIIFYHANNGIILAYLPSSLTEEQYYALDLLTLYMDDIKYMEARIMGQKKDFLIQENIGENFSKEVIQFYFAKNKKR